MEADSTTIWQGIEMRMPGAWEMTRYGLRHERGACTFMDETRERFHLAWQRGADCPDFDRLLSDMKARAAVESGGKAGIAPLAVGGAWRGFVIAGTEVATARAAAYFPDDRALVEAALFWFGDRSPALEAAVLASVRPGPAQAPQRWHAFGIDVQVPAGMGLSECRCLPGSVAWTFSAAKGAARWSIRRLAFPSVWLKEPIAAWTRKQVPDRFRVRRSETRTCPAGHPLSVARSDRFDFRRLRRVHRWDYGCLCPAEQRVYHASAETRGPPPQPLALSCSCGRILP